MKDDDDRDRGMLGRPEDVRKALRAWGILLGAAGALFLGAALLTTE